MPRPLQRLLSLAAGGVALAAAGAGATASPAPAGSRAAPIDLGGGTIELKVQLPDGEGGFELRNEEEVRRFFNRANCLCPGDEEAEFAIKFSLLNAPSALDDVPVDVWFGTQCDSSDVTIRDANCTRVHTFADIEELRTPDVVPFTVGELAASCEPRESERRVYALIDPNDDGIDTASGDFVGGPLGILVDTQPPPAPDDIEATGGEGAVEISWTLPSSRAGDIEFFQVLCARADGSTDEDDDFPRDLETRYLTTSQACGLEDPTVCPQPVAVERVLPGEEPDAGPGEPDAGPGAPDGGAPMCSDLPGGLEQLDPMHLCAEVTGTESSVRVEGLENGVAYRIVLVVVDPSRNPLALDLGELRPSPVKDFWEDYKDRGGRASGGCSATSDGRGGLYALVLIALVTSALRAVRRRRRRRGGVLFGALVLVGATGSASAQPWWEDTGAPVQEEVGPSPIGWSFEIKFGPYVPDVDSEFDLAEDEAGPFEQMFGDGPFLMSGITVDRYFLYPAGQLGVTGSAGYFSQTARAYQVDDAGNVLTDEDGNPVRSEGDETRFRMIPMSLGLVYRFTLLDDLYRIPLVPYGRAGLSYYYWWVSAPNGDLAEVPTMECPDVSSDDCEGDKARGGSLGWQATAGLALRLERLDPDAEVSLRTELGIEHAGLVVEVTYAKVDGFGAGDKLAVGDLTWFGGIAFEF